MNFCQGHWDMLKKAIDDRGLTDLVAPDGETVAAMLAKQIEDGKATPTTFDPLMGAMFAISNNAADLVQKQGGNPLYVMVASDEEQPIEGIPGYEGRTWPFCPLCHINLAHEIFCRVPDCTMDREHGYDSWINNAADDMVTAAKELGLK
jgi:hypothetical protein